MPITVGPFYLTQSRWHVTSRNQGLSFASRRSKKDPGNEVGSVEAMTVGREFAFSHGHVRKLGIDDLLTYLHLT
jgi:hypothetical protein